MNLFKVFGLKKEKEDADEWDLLPTDEELISKLHQFWMHIEHPETRGKSPEDHLFELQDIGLDGPDGLLSIFSRGPQVKGWIPENFGKFGSKPFPTPLADGTNLHSESGTYPVQQDPKTGEFLPLPLDRKSLHAGLNNPEYWNLGDFFEG